MLISFHKKDDKRRPSSVCTGNYETKTALLNSTFRCHTLYTKWRTTPVLKLIVFKGLTWHHFIWVSTAGELDWSLIPLWHCFYHFFHSDVTRTGWGEGQEKRQDVVFKMLTRPSHILQMCTHISLSSCSPMPGYYYFHKASKKKNDKPMEKLSGGLVCNHGHGQIVFRSSMTLIIKPRTAFFFFLLIGQNWLCS